MMTSRLPLPRILHLETSMDLDRDPHTIAHAAAEEIRTLNHATLKPANYPYPATVHDTALALKTLAERLPQALTQLGAGLDALADADQIQLIAAEGETVTERRVQVAELLQQAEAAAAELTEALRGIGTLTSDMAHLGHED